MHLFCFFVQQFSKTLFIIIITIKLQIELWPVLLAIPFLVKPLFLTFNNMALFNQEACSAPQCSCAEFLQKKNLPPPFFLLSNFLESLILCINRVGKIWDCNVGEACFFGIFFILTKKKEKKGNFIFKKRRYLKQNILTLLAKF